MLCPRPNRRSKVSCERSLARSTRTRQSDPHPLIGLDDLASRPSSDAMDSLSYLRVLRPVLPRYPASVTTISRARPYTPGRLEGCLSPLSCVRLDDPRSGVSLIRT